MPNILFIDTCGSDATYLLLNEEGILARRVHTVQKEHGQTINQYLADMVAEVALNLSDLNAIAVLNGPGSYTGLRISLATAKGICYALSIPLMLINGLDLMFQHSHQEGVPIATILQAREGEYYAGFYGPRGETLVAPCLMMEGELAGYCHEYNANLRTTESKLLDKFESLIVLQWDDEIIRKHILDTFYAKNFADLFNSEPFYLKNVHINKINKL